MSKGVSAMEREEIIKIKRDEIDNQPMASKRTRAAYSALNDALDEYIEAIQDDAFYFGYIAAIKHCEKVGTAV